MADALRDLKSIQATHRKRELKELYKNKLDQLHKENTAKLIEFAIAELQKAPKCQMLVNQLQDKIAQHFEIKSIKEMVGMSAKQFWQILKDKNMVQVTRADDGFHKLIKLIAAKLPEEHWYNEHKTQLEVLCLYLAKIFEDDTSQQREMKALSKEIAGNFGQKSLSTVFGLTKKRLMEIWEYLEQQKKIIKLNRSMDDEFVYVLWNGDGEENDDDEEEEEEEEEEEAIKHERSKKKKKRKNVDVAEESVLKKKRKIVQYVEKYNKREIGDAALVKKVSKQLNKLQAKHEIHFHFKVVQPSSDEESSSSSSSSSESDSDDDDI